MHQGCDVITTHKSDKKPQSQTAGKACGRDIQKVKARVNREPPFDVQNKTIPFIKKCRRGS